MNKTKFLSLAIIALVALNIVLLGFFFYEKKRMVVPMAHKK
jgi:uncharacterized membrane protein YuzA (DUF378 family)